MPRATPWATMVPPVEQDITITLSPIVVPTANASARSCIQASRLASRMASAVRPWPVSLVKNILAPRLAASLSGTGRNSSLDAEKP